jgi:hypothetical protein
MRVFRLQGGEKWPTEMVRDMRGMRGKWPTEIVRDMRGMRGKSESRQEVVRDNLPTEPFWRAAFHASSAHVAGK